MTRRTSPRPSLLEWLRAPVTAACLASAAPGALAPVAFELSGCRERDDGTSPTGVAESLPTLALKDETPDLLFTWIDAKGNAHTAVSIGEIPEVHRAAVRVVTREAGHGASFYVADLTRKQADETYAVRTIPRSEWEQLLDQRRAAGRTPPPPPPPASAAPSDGTEHRAPHPSAPLAESDPSAPNHHAPRGVSVTVYGAEWCGPCHEARAHLERRGASVTYYDVDREPARARELQSKLRAAGRSGGSIPVIDVQGKLLVGFNPRAIDSALEKAQKGGVSL